MKNWTFALSVLLVPLGIYLILAAVGAEENVVLATGHHVPKGLTGMLGAVVIFGALAVMVETFSKRRKESALRQVK